MKCTGCGKEYPDYESACPQCGAAQSSSAFDSVPSFSFDTKDQSGFSLGQDPSTTFSYSFDTKDQSGFSVGQDPSTAFSYSFDSGTPVLEAGGKVQKQKAADRYMNVNCPACMSLIYYGEEIRICRKCDTPYHDRCFPPGGCSSPACSGQGTAPVKAKELPPVKETPVSKPTKVIDKKPAAAGAAAIGAGAASTKKIADEPAKTPARQPQPPSPPPPVKPPVSGAQGRSDARGVSSTGVAMPGSSLNDYIGRPCPVCENRIFKGDEIYICNNCDRAYHKFCFPANGCQSPYCGEGKGVAKKVVLDAGGTPCRKCGQPIRGTVHRCPHCGTLTADSPERAAGYATSYSTPSQDANLGWNSLVLGIASVFLIFIPCLGCIGTPLCGISAIAKGKTALGDPAQAGAGKVGYYLGITALCIYGLMVLGYMIGMPFLGRHR